MTVSVGDRFARRHAASRGSTSNTTAADITYDTAVFNEGSGYTYTGPHVAVDTAGLYLFMFDLGQVDQGAITDRAVGTLVPRVNGSTDLSRFRATHRYLRDAGGAQHGASIGMMIWDATANDNIRVRNPGTGATGTDAYSTYATNAAYGGGLQLIKLPDNNFTHVERTSNAAEVGTSNINTTRPWLDSSGTWTTITYNSEVSDDDSLYPGSGGDITLKANKKYLIVWGANIGSTDASRHTDVVRLQVNGNNVQSGSGYQRNTASQGPPMCGMYLHETGGTTETVRLQATHETEGGDAGTPNVQDAYLQVLELNSSTEWIHVDNGSTNSLTTALAGTTTWYDTPLSSTVRAHGDSDLSLDSPNDAVQNDSGASMPILAIGWHRWDRDSGSSGTRKNPWTRWNNGGSAVGYGVAGAYSRGQQSGDDTFQAHYCSAALMDLGNGSDLKFQVNDEASSGNSDMGIYASTASNRYFLGVQVLDLNTLEAAGTEYDETGRSASFDATTDSTDSVDFDEQGLSAEATMTVDSTDQYTSGSSTITLEQSKSAAGSGSTFDATFDTAPTAGNLLIIITTNGSTCSIDSSESTWAEAHDMSGSADKLTVWWKIADGDATDNNINFDLASSSQYAWATHEFSTTADWETSPVDKTGDDGINATDRTSQTSGTTATTSQAQELAIAGFRLRDHADPPGPDAAVTNVSFTNSFTKAEQAGTLYTQTYSLELLTAWVELTTTGAKSTLASWTGTVGSGAGIIVTFKLSVGTEYDETGRDASFDVTADSTDTVDFAETALDAEATLTPDSTDTAGFADTSAAQVELTADSSDTQAQTDTVSALVDLTTATSETAAYDASGALSAQVELTTDSAENVALEDTLVAAVDMTSAGTDTVAFTESCSAQVDLTVDSTDQFVYKELNRTAAVDLTVDSTDAASLVDSRASPVDLTTDSTDVIAAVDAAEALVDLTTDSTEGLTYAESVAALVELTTDSTDDYTMSESLSALVDLTPDSTDNISAEDSISAEVTLTVDSTDTHNTATQVTYDNASSDTGTSTTSLTFSHTVTTEANRLLVVGVEVWSSGGGGTPTSVKYNDVSMTLITNGNQLFGPFNEERLLFYYLVAPSTGANNVVITMPSSETEIVAGAVSFYGVNQSDPLGTLQYDTTDNRSSATLSVTDGATGDMVVDLIANWDDTSYPTVGANQTGRVAEQNGTNYDSLHMSTEPGGSSITMSWSWSQSEYPGHMAININKAGASYDESGRSATVDFTVDSSETQDMEDLRSATVDLTTAGVDTAAMNNTFSALVEFTTDSTDTMPTAYDETGRAATVDLTTDSTDGRTVNEQDLAALVEFTVDSTDNLVEPFVNRIQSDSGAGSGASWQASLPVAPTAGNLLVVACAAGAIINIDSSETTWRYADGADIDNIAIWYKVADGDSTDNNVDFSIGLPDQYGWVMVEYDTTQGWKTDPLDQTAHDGVNAPNASSQTSGTTGVINQNRELAFAVFRLRGSATPISGDTLTNSFTEAEYAGTELGVAWALEIFGVDKGVSGIGTVETTLSWTSGDTSNQGAVIATFMPNTVTYDETGRSATVELATASSETVDLDDTSRTALVELTTDSNDHLYGPGHVNETGRSAVVEFTTANSSSLTSTETLEAEVELTAQVTRYEIPYLASGPGSVAGSPSSTPAATGAPGVPSVHTTVDSPSVGSSGGTPGVTGAEGVPSVNGPSGIPSVNYDEND